MLKEKTRKSTDSLRNHTPGDVMLSYVMLCYTPSEQWCSANSMLIPQLPYNAKAPGAKAQPP